MRRLSGTLVPVLAGLTAGFLTGSPLLERLVGEGVVGSLAVSAAMVAGWMMPVAALVFVADGIFFGLLRLGTVIASTAAGAVVLISLIWGTSLGDSLEGIWWGIGAMLVARGLIYLVAYRRSVRVAVRS